MRRSVWRLSLASLLFVGWIGFLAYLAATTTKPTVLARPQFLSADVWVVAEVGKDRFWPALPQLVAVPAGGPMAAALLQSAAPESDLPGEMVQVRKVLWANKSSDRDLSRVYVKNMGKCGPTFGWEGPGEYLLALSHTNDGEAVYQVTPLPRTPGFIGSLGLGQSALVSSKIYKATPAVIHQAEALAREYGR